jgi:hypothetical protein
MNPERWKLKNMLTGEELNPEFFGRPDLREIMTAAMGIAFRECVGDPERLMMACSDDTRGCLLFRAAMRGDIDAMALLAKVPRLRIRMGTSEDWASIASQDPAKTVPFVLGREG